MKTKFATEKPLLFRTADKQWLLVSPSLSSPGGWRVTAFTDLMEPVSHCEAATHRDAIRIVSMYGGDTVLESAMDPANEMEACEPCNSF